MSNFSKLESARLKWWSNESVRNEIEENTSIVVSGIAFQAGWKSAQQSVQLTAFGVGMLAFLAGFGICWLAFVR